MKVDVVIVGGGLVGSAFACALADTGLRAALVEQKPLTGEPGPEWDSRVYAISPGSVRFLETLGVWHRLDHARVAPVLEMAIHGDEKDADLRFSAYDAGLPELAHIVENNRLQAALWQRCHTISSLQVRTDAGCAALEIRPEGVALELDDGERVEASLIVAADGARSWVRTHAGITTNSERYGQLGVVANFRTARPHDGIARQWFREDGVLAWLPLPDGNISIVWSAVEEKALSLLGLPADRFTAAVCEAGQAELGEMQLLGPPLSFPLQRMKANQMVKPGVALIGDAAHTVHPLAGQGVNLGFQDAQSLANVLKNRGRLAECGDYGLLRRYERSRAEDVMAMQWVTDGLYRLFSHANPAVKVVRNMGLRMTNDQSWLKQVLVKHALG